ncbi:daunorubicin resistance protein DrrA family ABC transporter ATP-binding protein [Sciscionella sediminilitoris]|uniref:daunorubicin resistance protein DrrA family ABC transporter ATP-binding protein n=1 Tax=Sciscionella sediminilitoris TaxID=1445613 RepID=UPI0004DF6AB5|nr:daunorubicin resistance protein DrrA family ABC transporter ATP-binding protein [Sciscionella sp. SE31]
MTAHVRIEDLHKSFGGKPALRGVDLAMRGGEVFALLGRNGAGKTTTVRILTTLLRPDSGRVFVAGHDVLRTPDRARSAIGVSGQYAAVDEKLTGFENLYLVARLYGMRRARAADRTRELLARFHLDTVMHNRAGSYSGGMRRRLDLAGALIAEPSLVVLDEPTTGLDPQSRQDTWALVRDLAAKGTTVLLTTQYLEEADQLADRIAVLEDGAVVAEGTADELKRMVGGERIELVLAEARDIPAAEQILAEIGDTVPHVDESARRLELRTESGQIALADVVARLNMRAIPVLDLGLRRATLDDVFLALTEEPAAKEVPA